MINSLESLAGSLGLNAGNSYGIDSLHNIKVNPDLRAVYAAESMEAQKDLEGLIMLIGIAENSNLEPDRSEEGFKETMNNFWEKVKEFFIKIGNWFKKLFLKIKSLFVKDKEEAKTENEIATVVSKVDPDKKVSPEEKKSLLQKVGSAGKETLSKILDKFGSKKGVRFKVPVIIKDGDWKGLYSKFDKKCDFISNSKVFEKYIELLDAVDKTEIGDKSTENLDKLLVELKESWNLAGDRTGDQYFTVSKEQLKPVVFEFKEYSKFIGIVDADIECTKKTMDIIDDINKSSKECQSKMKVLQKSNKGNVACQKYIKEGFSFVSMASTDMVKSLTNTLDTSKKVKKYLSAKAIVKAFGDGTLEI